jgi:hypothetical protein
MKLSQCPFKEVDHGRGSYEHQGSIHTEKATWARPGGMGWRRAGKEGMGVDMGGFADPWFCASLSTLSISKLCLLFC